MLEGYGLAETAAANNIVILMPQGDVESPTNCFDGGMPSWLGTDNWSHDGVQVKSILNMINRLKEPKAAGFADLE